MELERCLDCQIWRKEFDNIDALKVILVWPFKIGSVLPI